MDFHFWKHLKIKYFLMIFYQFCDLWQQLELAAELDSDSQEVDS